MRLQVFRDNPHLRSANKIMPLSVKISHFICCQVDDELIYKALFAVDVYEVHFFMSMRGSRPASLSRNKRDDLGAHHQHSIIYIYVCISPGHLYTMRTWRRASAAAHLARSAQSKEFKEHNNEG
jgi:hypothetical protein